MADPRERSRQQAQVSPELVSTSHPSQPCRKTYAHADPVQCSNSKELAQSITEARGELQNDEKEQIRYLEVFPTVSGCKKCVSASDRLANRCVVHIPVAECARNECTNGAKHQSDSDALYH